MCVLNVRVRVPQVYMLYPSGVTQLIMGYCDLRVTFVISDSRVASPGTPSIIAYCAPTLSQSKGQYIAGWGAFGVNCKLDDGNAANPISGAALYAGELCG